MMRLFGGEEPEDQVIVEFTPTPAPTKAPDLTPTIAPNAQTTIYTSADKKISMKLPDATWSNKMDEEDIQLIIATVKDSPNETPKKLAMYGLL